MYLCLATDYHSPYKTHMYLNKVKPYIVYLTLCTNMCLVWLYYHKQNSTREQTQGKHGEYHSDYDPTRYDLWDQHQSNCLLDGSFRSAVQRDWLKNTELKVNISSLLEGFALLMLFIIMAAFLYFVARWFLELVNNHFRKKKPDKDVSFPFSTSNILNFLFFFRKDQQRWL